MKQEWVLLETKTTPSGKLLYKCNLCGAETPAPTKWKFHGPQCYMMRLKRATSLLELVHKAPQGKPIDKICLRKLLDIGYRGSVVGMDAPETWEELISYHCIYNDDGTIKNG